MKSTKTKPEIIIPSEIVSLLKRNVTLSADDGIVLIMDTEMTALEVINMIEHLEHIVTGLYKSLLDRYEQDDTCDDCTFCEDFMEDCVDVPEWAKEVAGLHPDTKLAIVAEEDSGRILLEPIGAEHDLSDVSERMQAVLTGIGICLGELNEGIISGEVVYGA